MPGRAACPALEPRGRWTPRHAERPQPQATEPTKSALDQAAERARLRGQVGWRRLRLGVGHARDRPASPSTPGVVGDRGSHRERCLPLVPGAAGQARSSGRGWSIPLRPPAGCCDRRRKRRQRVGRSAAGAESCRRCALWGRCRAGAGMPGNARPRHAHRPRLSRPGSRPSAAAGGSEQPARLG
jgi:hypothetical protein